MDFWAATRVVGRRWYVVVPALLLCLAGSFAMYSSIPTLYLSKSIILLTAPLTGPTVYGDGFKPNIVNPLLDSNSGLSLAGTTLIQSMRTTEFEETIGVPRDGRTTFSVNNGTDNPELLISGPFVFMTAESSSAQEAQDLVTRAVAAARDELKRRQAAISAPLTTYVEIAEIVPPSTPVSQRGDRFRAAGTALVVGLILSLASAFAAESIANARRRAKQDTSEDAAPPPAGSDPPSESAPAPAPRSEPPGDPPRRRAPAPQPAAAASEPPVRVEVRTSGSG